MRNYWEEGTIYVGRVIIFWNKILGRLLFFVPKLGEVHIFFIAKPTDLNISPSKYLPTYWSFGVNSNRSLVQTIPNIYHFRKYTCFILFAVV